jgi:hypothetical protein
VDTDGAVKGVREMSGAGRGGGRGRERARGVCEAQSELGRNTARRFYRPGAIVKVDNW